VTALGGAFTPTEAAVAELWAGCLATPPASPDDDFFDLGGSSLSLVGFLIEIHDRYRVELPMAELFGTGFTVAATAEAIDGAVAERDRSVP
jgi:acyl carrier protein